uniref:rhomboid protease n=1 Tax=Amphora coffeiformis TaxID=265554 RepID=A0A7S3L8V8_9STRA|mmetsp:Transcript_12576/g.24151  ORF Transcript_12576/g.24151 Transcript_12576/m.24151 type:complete len:534 (+) Transcript_12576:236-1837(+)|eukprot:scaffold3257_cov152-Amphora_coffeaeformis.AAC.2
MGRKDYPQGLCGDTSYTTEPGILTTFSHSQSGISEPTEIEVTGKARGLGDKKMSPEEETQSVTSHEYLPSTLGELVEEVEEDADEIERRKYSISQLVACLGSGADISDLPPELERRVRDFHLAQQKRNDKYGTMTAGGVYGMYVHLASVRIDLEWAEDAAWRRHNDEPYLAWTDFDDIRIRGFNRPWLTYAFIFTCSVMMFLEFAFNSWSMESLDLNPLIGPSAQTLRELGARDTNLIVEHGQWWRLFTPLVLHAGIVHYLFNMAAFFFIGGAVEQSHGMFNTFLIFMISGVGGNILSAIFLSQYISVGASGGIFGLIGACLADIMLNWNILFLKSGEDDDKTRKRNFWAIFWIFIEIVVNILLGTTPLIDNFTHLGGGLYGFCCGLSTIEAAVIGFFGYKATYCDQIRSFLIRFFGLIASVIFIMLTTAWLASSEPGENPCPGCRYFSCVPFPWWSSDKWWQCDDCDSVTANLISNSGSEFYSRINLTCPNNETEIIDVSGSMIPATAESLEEMASKLPGYCRDYCSEVFSN